MFCEFIPPEFLHFLEGFPKVTFCKPLGRSFVSLGVSRFFGLFFDPLFVVVGKKGEFKGNLFSVPENGNAIGGVRDKVCLEGVIAVGTCPSAGL